MRVTMFSWDELLPMWWRCYYGYMECDIKEKEDHFGTEGVWKKGAITESWGFAKKLACSGRGTGDVAAIALSLCRRPWRSHLAPSHLRHLSLQCSPSTLRCNPPRLPRLPPSHPLRNSQFSPSQKMVLLLQPLAHVHPALALHSSSSRTRTAPPACVRRRCASSPFKHATTLQRSSFSSSIPSISFPFRFQMDAEVLSSCRAQKQENEVQEGATASVPEDPRDIILQGWPKVALYLFGLGFLLGPPLDAIHSRVQLQIYDQGAVDISGLHTNVWVFPMLGLFYSVAGVLQLVLDRYLAPRGSLPTADLKKVVFSLITLATLLEVSAELYKAGVPFNIEAYILFFLAEANWLVFDNTWWGFGLATLVGTLCPLIEMPLNKLFGLWHYPKGNFELFGESTVTWLIACYFFYTPFISNLARYLSSVTRTRSPQKRLD